VEGDVFQVADEGASLGQDFGAAGEDVDGFVFGEEADELGELRRDGLKVIGPGVWIAWPSEPDAGLGLPLRRPAVAGESRRGVSREVTGAGAVAVEPSRFVFSRMSTECIISASSFHGLAGTVSGNSATTSLSSSTSPYGPGRQAITTGPLGTWLPLTGSSVTCTTSGDTANPGPSAIRCALPSTSGWTVPREVHLL